MTGNREQADTHSETQEAENETQMAFPNKVSDTSFFQHLVTLVPNGTVVINEDGTVVFANPTITNVLGYSPSEVVGEPFATFIVDDHQTRIPSVDYRWDEESTDRLSLRARHAHGHEIQISIDVHEFTQDSHRLLAGFIQNQLHHEPSEWPTEHYEVLAELAGDAVYQLDTEGYFERVNESIVELTGYSRNELIGEHVSMFLNEKTITQDRDVLTELRATGDDQIKTTEFDLQTAEGEAIPCEVHMALVKSDGVTQGTVGVVRNVSKRKKRVEELRQERGLIKHVLDTSPIGIGVITPDGDISQVNDRAEELLGLTMEEISNQTFDVSQRSLYDSSGESVPPENLLRRVFDDGEQVLNSEFTLERPDGDRVWVTISIAPIESSTEAGEKAVVIATDISDRKKRERRMRESEARLRQIAENINSAIWMADADMSEILYINPAYETITGRLRDSVYDSLFNHLDAVHPQDRQRVADAMKRAPQMSQNELGGRRFQEKYRIVRPDGSIRWVTSFAFPLLNDDGDVYRFVENSKLVSPTSAVHNERVAWSKSKPLQYSGFHHN
ncbi:PAS domain-containing protein [Halegenticoccus soli]|uniref:PAS domain-containing protein n=1 Tax=Halegenticoccus soli TaxID=1985678 RepID=UPI000C6D5221|nr:PAS domain S-box protein [Halegenticoccus soli]